MAKITYRVPASLDKRIGDAQINVAPNAGMKPMSLSVLVGYFISALLCAGMVTSTFIKDGGILLISLFVVLWAALTWTLMSRDATGLPQYSLISAVASYIPKHMRRCICRSSGDAKAFMTMLGINDVDRSTGRIAFSDGCYGYLYQVVGSASLLLFDADRDAILDHVDAFWRKIRPDVEVATLTVYSAQHVGTQMANLKRRYDALDDDELKALADMEFNTLRYRVGTQHRSLHQYLLVRADNKEALTTMDSTLRIETESSSLMFKRCARLDYDNTLQVFAQLYQGKESV